MTEFPSVDISQLGWKLVNLLTEGRSSVRIPICNESRQNGSFYMVSRRSVYLI
ncbi:hypothetical protein P9F83_22925 [Peribacillus psychrosaccharolyticus]|uniref:hypothetical protein n=1 Tax=Peribacillus psychrosaccharolyticus TaxID=1407 RepID=UPI002DBA5059|nr:hypothetical protein [Peribacillus psychrosaccharolyticus]MEC2058019.1 hypothetical protein [Peribacillus psychrosaccharolyticus]